MNKDKKILLKLFDDLGFSSKQLWFFFPKRNCFFTKEILITLSSWFFQWWRIFFWRKIDLIIQGIPQKNWGSFSLKRIVFHERTSDDPEFLIFFRWWRIVYWPNYGQMKEINISVYHDPGGQSLLPVLPQGGQYLRPQGGQGVPLILLEPQGGECLRPHKGQGLPLIVLKPKGGKCLRPQGIPLTVQEPQGGHILDLRGGGAQFTSVSSMPL